MNQERFDQIQDLYHAVLESPSALRDAVLKSVDPELRREVESLLEERTGGGFLEQPALAGTAELDETTASARQIRMFGRFKIDCKIGEGGMGEVFRAIDTRLGRAVALKTTHARFNDRFEREARAISALNHPHICTLYDVGPNFLVMEFLEGETLASHLKQGPLPLQTAILYAQQIASALVEAHSKGIIHRDLKPGNVMVGKSGVKVLDFGLAKSDVDESITASQMVMGTPAYMAPEQRQGKPADTRSDIYSFGCLVYEMLTGGRIHHERKRIPARKLESIVSRCLEEDPMRRWQSAVELEEQLAAVSTRAPKKTSVAPRGEVSSRKTPVKAVVVLGEITNTTGDPAFDHLRQLTSVELGRSPNYALLPDVRMRQALTFMGLPANTKLSPEISAELCERTGSTAVVDGSITRLGRQYVLSLRVRNGRTEEVLHEDQKPLTKKGEVFQALVLMARKLGSRTGAIPPTEKLAAMATEVTTPSREAWRWYSTAWNTAMRKGVSAEVVALYQRAIQFDPNFAMAYAALGRAYDSLGQAELAAQCISKAYDLRQGVSDRENFFITFNFYRQVPRNFELARQTLESWTRMIPDDLLPHGFLSGLVSPGTAHHEQAAAEGMKAIEADPDFAIGYVNTMFACLYLNRPQDAAELLRKAAERNIEAVEFSVCRYYISFLARDEFGMEREVADRKKLKAQGWFEHQEALTLAYQGRLKEAKRLSEYAITLARQGGLPERAAMFEGACAVWNAQFGALAEAEKCALSALSISRGRDADYGPALALALTGNLARSREIAFDLAERFPEDTSIQFSYLPTLRGLYALAEDKPDAAVEATLAAVPYEYALPGCAYFTGASFFGALYPVYVRGLAYNKMGKSSDAVAEFQKIVDRRGMTLNDPMGALARLQLARALRHSTDRARAASAYDELLIIWKDADREVPRVREAFLEREAFLQEDAVR